MIGDDARPDGEVDGLGTDELLALHRSLVLLRTYDERSVEISARPDRHVRDLLGHEAVQAGAVHALEQRDWVFPELSRGGDRPPRGLRVSTVLSWWRGRP